MEDIRHISLLVAVTDVKFLQDLREKIARQKEIELVGEPEDTVQTLRAVRHVRPDVLLLDAKFSNREGSCSDSPLLTAIHHGNPDTKIILLSDKCTQRSVVKAFEQGARGCMSASALAADCLRAIRAVDRGEVWIGRKEMASVLDKLLIRLERAEEASGTSANLLSERELEIASAVRLGMTNKEIARRMRISPTTVKTHLEHIFHKLHVTHRVQLAVLTRPSGTPETQTESGTLNGHNSGPV